MYLFLDANIFVSIFGLTEGELHELEKLVDAASTGVVELISNEILENEFQRNRDRELARTLKILRSQKLGLKLPTYARSAPEARHIEEDLKQVNKKLRALVDRVSEQALEGALFADDLVNQIFEVSHSIPIDEDVKRLARERSELRYPPGKPDDRSIGDALHWQVLLKHVPKSHDLSIISKDGDFFSRLDGTKPHPFLQKEWTNMGRRKQLFAYKDLASFFKQHLPNVDLKGDLDVEFLVSALENASHPDQVKEIFERMSGHIDLTYSHVARITSAYYENPIVERASKNYEVRSFFEDLYEGYKGTEFGATLFEIVDDTWFDGF